MEIKSETKRSDLFWLNIRSSFISPMSYILFTFFVFGYLTRSIQKGYLADGILCILTQIVMAFVWGAIIISAIILLIILLNIAFASRKDGILGIHVFRIEEDGLREITEANDSLAKWSGIKSIKKYKKYIVVQINRYMFHIIPARSFPIKADYDSFYNELNKKWKEG